jgi:hypothetical protein
MRVVVYALCALTSLAAAILLIRGYARSRARLLFWSGLCFALFFVNNVLLVVDQRLVQDLSVVRTLPSLVGMLLLLYGLIWDARR